MIFLLVVTVVVCTSGISIYFSQRYLASARLAVGSLMPMVQRAKDIQQAATEVKGYSRSLSNSNSPAALHQAFSDLTIALAKLEKLTSMLSNEDSGIDIVSLNFLNQAVQSQTNLIFQVKAQLLKQEAQQLKIIKELRRDLLKTGFVDFSITHSYEKENHASIHKILEQSLVILEKLDMPDVSLSDVNQLENEFARTKNRTVLLPAGKINTAKEKGGGRLINGVRTSVERLLELKQQSLSVALRINDFNKTQNELSDKLTLLTNQHIDKISTESQENMQLLLKREKQSIYLALCVLVASLILLYLFHHQIIVRGFGDRLSLISQAMRQGVAGEKNLPLPVADQDEIADMARAAEELLKKARELKKLATIDELTKVYNRRYFFHLVHKEILRAERNQLPAAIAIIDIDYFKKVNDAWGHDFGDKALFEFAQACKQVIRKVDLFARYGGEEFILFMPGATVAKGTIVANRVLKSIESIELYTDSGRKVHITASIGLADAALTTETLSQSIKKADKALYAAKESGRNRVEIYSAKLGH